MIGSPSTQRTQLRSEIVSRWRNGSPANTSDVLREHPEWASDKATVLKLAHEEFCLRRQQGETVDAGYFAQQFPGYSVSLRRLLEVEELLNSANAEAEPDWPEEGTACAGFELLEELGRGAFSRVYLAREPHVGDRLVAVKITASAVAEAALLGKLNHPNIVSILSVIPADEAGPAVIAMPFYGVSTLSQVLDEVARDGMPSSGRVIAEICRPTSYQDLLPAELAPLRWERTSNVNAVI